MHEIRQIDGSLFACGMGRQVYRRNASGAWSPAHQGALLPPATKEPGGFNSIHGMMEDELWAVGFQGEIWRCQSGGWTAETSPTTFAPNKILVVSDRLAFIAGKVGTLLRWDGAGWALLPQPGLDVELWDLAWFQDRLFVAIAGDLLVLDESHRCVRHTARNHASQRLGRYNLGDQPEAGSLDARCSVLERRHTTDLSR
jgi:hypothetical protein